MRLICDLALSGCSHVFGGLVTYKPYVMTVELNSDDLSHISGKLASEGAVRLSI